MRKTVELPGKALPRAPRRPQKTAGRQRNTPKTLPESRSIALQQTQRRGCRSGSLPVAPSSATSVFRIKSSYHQQLRHECPETPDGSDAKDGGRSGREREQQCHAVR
jgi:hypothetical protein